jgi:hypothetical protein
LSTTNRMSSSPHAVAGPVEPSPDVEDDPDEVEFVGSAVEVVDDCGVSASVALAVPTASVVESVSSPDPLAIPGPHAVRTAEIATPGRNEEAKRAET